MATKNTPIAPGQAVDVALPHISATTRFRGRVLTTDEGELRVTLLNPPDSVPAVVYVDQGQCKVVGDLVTREQYMDGQIDHDTYYSQFVTYGVLQLVRSGSIKRVILSSKDPHFNDIPLNRWDLMAGALPSDAILLHKLADRGGISRANRVCILKAAAKQLRKWS